MPVADNPQFGARGVHLLDGLDKPVEALERELLALVGIGAGDLVLVGRLAGEDLRNAI